MGGAWISRAAAAQLHGRNPCRNTGLRSAGAGRAGALPHVAGKGDAARNPSGSALIWCTEVGYRELLPDRPPDVKFSTQQVRPIKQRKGVFWGKHELQEHSG